jgi:nucleoside-diphosphate-sugar epimerase
VRAVDLVGQALRDTDEIIALTGATGWFGAVALDLLYEALGDEAPARVFAYASAEREVVTADGRAVRVRPLDSLLGQDPRPTTLLHCAFLTRDKVAALGIDSYVSQNVAITATVCGAIAKHRPRHVVAMSSGAVYSSTGVAESGGLESGGLVSGGLVSDLRGDPYGTLKHVDELAFRTAARDAGGICVIPRVFSVAGARMTKPGLYALGSMIGMATAGGPIEVRARGPVFRSYCGVDEVVALALWAALSGHDAVFDTRGTVVEVGELAAVVAEVHGLDANVVRRTWDREVAADRYVGDGRLMEELAEEAGLAMRSLPDLVRETSDWLSGSNLRG